MSRKGKTHEITDILDSAYTETDYSHGNGYYDEIRDYQRPRNTIPNHNTNNVGVLHSLAQASSNTKPEKNMFLKYSQNDTTNGTGANTGTNTGTSTNTNTGTNPKMLVDYDNFPSLGGKPNTSKLPSSLPTSNQSKCLDYKKVVTTPSPIAVPVPLPANQRGAPVQEQSSQNNYTTPNKLNRYFMYNNIKDNSEKSARLRMENEYSSDNDDDY